MLMIEERSFGVQGASGTDCSLHWLGFRNSGLGILGTCLSFNARCSRIPGSRFRLERLMLVSQFGFRA